MENRVERVSSLVTGQHVRVGDHRHHHVGVVQPAELGTLATEGARLIGLQAPAQHWSSAGLAATRTFAALIQ